MVNLTTMQNNWTLCIEIITIIYSYHIKISVYIHIEVRIAIIQLASYFISHAGNLTINLNRLLATSYMV